MKIAHFNCKSGIAGDMIIASLIDSGLSAEILEKTLKKKLKTKDWELKVSITKNYHFPAKNLSVSGERHFTSPFEIRNIIKKSDLSDTVKKNSLKILDTLISAESKVHGVPTGKVHFHELNSMDTLIDITGACQALELLNIDKVFCSEINIGRPAPATLEILKEKQLPVYSNSTFETATPTGISIISNIAESFGAMPALVIEKSGYGAGTNEIPNMQNFLQVIIGSSELLKNTFEKDEVIILETNIDDMDLRVFPYVMENLFSAGAKDVWFTQIIMKKGRPAVKLSVICDLNHENEIVDIIFNETTTLGIRRMPCSRHILKRELSDGKKKAFLKKSKVKISAEYEVAKQKAIKTHQPVKDLL